MSASGFGGGSAANAGTHSPRCPTGWSRSGTTAFVAGKRLVSESQTGTLPKKRRRTAKMRLDYQMRRPVRRWVGRRLSSLWCRATIAAKCFSAAPTIFAWDLGAYCRMLRLEAKGP